jgi:hypothetical protein
VVALLVVGFDDGIEEVQGDDEDVDDATVRVEAGRAGGGFWVAGTDGNAVVNGLKPGCCNLLLLVPWQ